MVEERLSTSSYTIDRFGQKPYLGIVVGQIESDGRSEIVLILNVVDGFVSIVRVAEKTDIYLRVDVAQEVYVQVECILSELDALFGSVVSRFASASSVEVSGRSELGAVVSGDRIVLGVVGGEAQVKVMAGVECQLSISGADALACCLQLRLDIGRIRAERTRMMLAL